MIIDERGLFWDASQEIPKGQWAPDTAVYGKIKIDDNGSIALDLDGLLNGHKSLDIFINRNAEARNTIVGKIKNGNQSILIPDALGNGITYKSNNISSEKFVGLFCFVSKISPSHFIEHAANIDKIVIDIEKYGAVFDHSPIKCKQSGDVIDIKYEPSDAIQFDVDDRIVEISQNVDIPFWETTNLAEIHLYSKPRIAYTFPHTIDASKVAKESRRFFDLLFLISNIRCCPDWPDTYSSKTKSRATLYFMRHKYLDIDFDRMKCWLTVKSLGESFIKIFENWCCKCDALGPAFYLYTSTKNEKDAYPEQNFMSLVTGLETLHRLTATPLANDNLRNKISRILSAVDKKDRRWLAKILDKSMEPTLDKRLFEMIYKIDLDFSKDGLNAFCQKCREIRNNISHFGSPNRSTNVSVTNQDIYEINILLSHFYHLSILNEIDIPIEQLASISRNIYVEATIIPLLKNYGILLPAPVVA